MQKGKQGYHIKLFAMLLFLLFAVLLSITLGRYAISLKELAGILFSRVGNIDAFWSPQQETILFNVRLPRIFMACLVGCCLSAAGASYQGVFQNPMASPDILGASSGAAFGAALAILLQLNRRMVTVFAFLFSLVTIALVLFISKQAKGKRVLGLILAGIMVSSLCTSGTSYIKLVADPNNILPEITYWLMGSLAKTRNEDVWFALVPMVIGLVPLMLVRWRINLLTLSDEEARTMGVNVQAVRVVVIVCATLVTAASVSVSGLIGWVGLVIPHFARRIVGNNYRALMPASMLCGAIFLLVVDNVSRNALAIEIPIGILTSFIGAPFFLWLITRRGETV
ncbi:MAG: FecCD family ABC transporter permease [Oscillospiraceae bacterium]